MGLIIRDKNPSSAKGADAGGKPPVEVFFCAVVDGGASDGLEVPFFDVEALRETGGCDAFGAFGLAVLPARLCARGAGSLLIAPDARLWVCRAGGMEVAPFEPEEAVGASSEAGSCTGLVGDLALGLLVPFCGGEGGTLVLAAGRLADLDLLEALAPPDGASELELVFLAGFFSGVLAGMAGFFSGVLLFWTFASFSRVPVGVVGVFGAGLDDLVGDVDFGDGLGAMEDLAVDIGVGRVADLGFVTLPELFEIGVDFELALTGAAGAETRAPDVGVWLGSTAELSGVGTFGSSSGFLGFSVISAGSANSLPHSGVGALIGSASPSCLLTSRAGVSAKADSGMISSITILAFLASNSCEIDSFLAAVSVG